LLKDGKELSRQREDWRDINEAGQRLTLTQFVDTKSLAAGEYEIQIRITDNISRETITPSAKFTVTNN